MADEPPLPGTNTPDSQASAAGERAEDVLGARAVESMRASVGESSVGKRLAAARQVWGMSVEDVARRTNLRIDAVVALEEDAYDRLPGTTFVRGYLRAYAKLLRIDDDEVIACANFKADATNQIPAKKTSLIRVRRGPGRNRGAFGWAWRLSLILIALVALLFTLAIQFTDLNLNQILQTLKEISFPWHIFDWMRSDS